MGPLLANCLPARLADHFSGDDFALRCHDDFGEALFKSLAAAGLSNFRNLARGPELQLLRGRAAWGFSAAAALLSFHTKPKLIAAAFFGGAMVTSIYGLVNASWLRVTRSQ